MKISKKTFDILKNFSGIRSSIYVDKGSVIRTVSTAKNIMAEAKVDENFPNPFAIYDLGEFIAAASVFSETDYNFGDKCVVLDSQKGGEIPYLYADEKSLVMRELIANATRTIKMPELSAEFELSSNQIAEVQKIASVLRLDTLCIKPNLPVGGIEIVAFDRKIGLNSASNTYKVRIKAKSVNTSGSVYIDIELLKMLTDDYVVEIGGSAVAKFTGTKNGVTYWIALRPETK
jgi:hypothetical protein